MSETHQGFTTVFPGKVPSFGGTLWRTSVVDERTVDVEYEPSDVDLDIIVTAIEDQGYEVDGR